MKQQLYKSVCTRLLANLHILMHAKRVVVSVHLPSVASAALLHATIDGAGHGSTTALLIKAHNIEQHYTRHFSQQQLRNSSDA
jgi:hypothetical protein